MELELVRNYIKDGGPYMDGVLGGWGVQINPDPNGDWVAVVYHLGHKTGFVYNGVDWLCDISEFCNPPRLYFRSDLIELLDATIKDYLLECLRVNCPVWAASYAITILEERWPEAEPHMVAAARPKTARLAMNKLYNLPFTHHEFNLVNDYIDHFAGDILSGIAGKDWLTEFEEVAIIRMSGQMGFYD